MKISSKQLGLSFAKLFLKSKSEEEKKELVSNFAKIIVSEQKISKLNLIKHSFNKNWGEISGELEIEIETPDGSTPNIPKEINGQKIVVKPKVNKDLVAGAIIKVGDYEVDNSLRTKIRKLANLNN